MTGCPGVVVMQEFDEEGVDMAGGTYFAPLKYKFCYEKERGT